MEQETHSLFGHIPARSRLKSRKHFLTSVNHLTSRQKSYDVTSSREGQGTSRDWAWLNLNEEPAKGYDSPWLTWQMPKQTPHCTVKTRGRNWATSMETQHVRAEWMKKIRRICYDVLS